MNIPGVGRYTARAVLVFAMGQHYGIFDPNVARLMERVFDIKSRLSRPHTDPEMWAAVDALVPKRSVREFNWALLDLASVVCQARKPKCLRCPMASLCAFNNRARLKAA